MKIEFSKSIPSREKLAMMYGVGGFGDASGKMAKIGGFGVSFVISRTNLRVGVQAEIILWKEHNFYSRQRCKMGSADRCGAVLWRALNAKVRKVSLGSSWGRLWRISFLGWTQLGCNLILPLYAIGFANALFMIFVSYSWMVFPYILFFKKIMYVCIYLLWYFFPLPLIPLIPSILTLCIPGVGMEVEWPHRISCGYYRFFFSLGEFVWLQ